MSRVLTAGGVVAATLLLFGCGSSSSKGDDGGKTASTPASSTTKTNTSASAGSSTGSAPKKVKATIKGFAFKPLTIRVATGGSVTWTDKDAANHTVTFTKGKSIGNLNEGQSGSITFKQAGTYKYVCDYHPNMHGTVIVGQ